MILRLHRIYSPQPLEPESEALLHDGAAHKLSRVLRVAAGQSFILFNGDGSDYLAEVVRPGKHQLLARVHSRAAARSESSLRITLVQALSRGERMDQTLQKATELGVAAFQPVVSERVELRVQPDRLERRMDHWRSVIISSCEQCGRAVIPAIAEPVNLASWLHAAGHALRLVLDPESQVPLAGLQPGSEVELLVGPEGGFSDNELSLARQHGVRPVSMGPRILRTETAGPAAIAILQSLAGDFR